MQSDVRKRSLLRPSIILVLFASLVVAAMFLSVAFRYEGNVSPRLLERLRIYFFYTLLVYLTCFVLFGMHTMPWRYTGTHMEIRIILACMTGTAVMLLLGWIFHWRILRSILCLTGMLCCILITIARFAWRIFRRQILQEDDLEKKRVLIVGTKELGRQAYQMCLQGEMPLKGIRHTPVAFVDDDLDVVFRNVCGIPVEGGYADIPKIIESMDIHEIILAVSDGVPVLLGKIIELCMTSRRYIPIYIIAERDGMGEIDNPCGKWQIRSLDISDLLPTDAVFQEVEGIRQRIEGRTVMATGGAGSMGSELCRQILRYNPRQVVILDMNENYLTQFFEEASESIRDKLAIVAGSIVDRELMEAVFARYRPEIVFHAAGYKNRFIFERYAEAIVRNNIMGTISVLEAAKRNGAEFFIHLSSDQAQEGNASIGLVKRIEEMSVQAHSGKMRCVSVRFGNTLGAYGGVVSRMKAEIDQGGPVRILNADLRQSFLSVKAAARGILQAASDGWTKKGDAYALITLDVGWPIQTRNLAEMLIRLRGYEPGKDIAIQFPEGQSEAEKARGDAETDPAALLSGVKSKGIVFESFEPIDAAKFQADMERLRLILSDQHGEDIYSLLQDIARDMRAERPSGPAIPYSSPASIDEKAITTLAVSPSIGG